MNNYKNTTTEASALSSNIDVSLNLANKTSNWFN